MKKFINDIKKYWHYALYASKSNLKSEVANSHLNWLWWLVEPICFTIIYMFMVQIIFHTKEAYFPVFVMIGMTVWGFFDKCMRGSVKTIANNRDVVTKVYIPKYILVLVNTFVNLFKMMVSFGLILILMIIFKVPFTIYLINFLPILFVLYVLIFGCSLIITHFGVFVEDLTNVLNLVLRLVFYMSGVFFSVATRVPAPFGDILCYANPVAYLMSEFRNITIYGIGPNYLLLGIWLFIGACLTTIGINLIYKYENSYAKVI